jgi:hypothetical protein
LRQLNELHIVVIQVVDLIIDSGVIIAAADNYDLIEVINDGFHVVVLL